MQRKILSILAHLAAFMLAVSVPQQAVSDESRAPELDSLFEILAGKDPSAAKFAEQEIWTIWSDSGSESLNLLLERGRSMMSKNRIDEAIEFLDVLVAQAPEFAEGWNARATAHFMDGNWPASFRDAFRTLELNPRHFGALSGVAMMFESLGQQRVALGYYARLTELMPHNAIAQSKANRLRFELSY